MMGEDRSQLSRVFDHFVILTDVNELEGEFLQTFS